MSTGLVSALQHPPHPDFRHDVDDFDGQAGFADRASRFIEEGLRRQQPVLVAVTVEHQGLLARSVGHPSPRFIDIQELGRNPSRIIPAVTEFVQEAGGQHCRFLGEPLWPGQTRAQTDEVARHEALIYPALSSYPLTILSVLPSRQIGPGMTLPTADLEEILSIERWPLAPGPPRCETIRFDLDLARMREQVEDYVEGIGIDIARADDLILAVNEVASNSVRYGGGGGVLRLWTAHDSVVCEVSDAGRITDPLVGRHPPGPDLEAPGLWLVNQLCDLVQIRSGPEGTRVRLEVRCTPPVAPSARAAPEARRVRHPRRV